VKKPAEVQIQEALDISVGAKSILESNTFNKAFADLEAQYIATWRKSKPAEMRIREDAYLMLRALDELKGNLKAAASAGGLVSFNLRRSIMNKSA
jgi:hypothetical protein